ncbi:hypothetical protein J1605_012756 [Eschrichtius robustus]|uniref:Uncharacterized protein n=1 Tax=Eschrichtius robustus TaxID=9764 RepID=A0AB34GI54_ESCRO|nr:hypothetical protein J1605_012756 [Eschrichtius robustus]
MKITSRVLILSGMSITSASRCGIEDMFNEIRFSEYVDTGKLIDKINLPDFFRVYLNHRPPFGNTMSGIQQSFDILGFTNSKGKKAIRREDFLKLLQTKGEHMTEEEMSDCFATLFGLNPEGWKSEPAASSVKGTTVGSVWTPVVCGRYEEHHWPCLTPVAPASENAEEQPRSPGAPAGLPGAELSGREPPPHTAHALHRPVWLIRSLELRWAAERVAAPAGRLHLLATQAVERPGPSSRVQGRRRRAAFLPREQRAQTLPAMWVAEQRHQKWREQRPKTVSLGLYIRRRDETLDTKKHHVMFF